MKQYSLIPRNYKDKDPRTLAYFYPTSLNIVAYAKKMQEFSFYQTLSVAEEMARKLGGYILVPYQCIHWKRAKRYGNNRKIKIGRNSFFLMKLEELTERERWKLKKYLEELHKK